jgi:hypothetical protein
MPAGVYLYRMAVSMNEMFLVFIFILGIVNLVMVTLLVLIQKKLIALSEAVFSFLATIHMMQVSVMTRQIEAIEEQEVRH